MPHSAAIDSFRPLEFTPESPKLGRVAIVDVESPQLTRRNLLVTGGTTLAGVFLTDLGTAAAARARPIRRGYRRARFAPHVGDRVTLTAPGGPPVRGRLVAVENVPRRKLAGSQRAYVLRFRVSPKARFSQRITTVRHPRFGKVKLLMVEGRSTRKGQEYVATVNRVVPRRKKRR